MTYDQLRAHLDTLSAWRERPWPSIGTAATAALTLTRQTLHDRDLWRHCPQHDRAAVHWATAAACVLRTAKPSPAARRYWEPRIPELASEIAHFVTWFDPDPDRWAEARPDRAAQGETAVHLHAALTQLPPMWQTEALRRAEPPQNARHPAARPFAEVLGVCAASRGFRAPFWVTDRSGPDSTDVLGGLTQLLAMPTGWQIECVRRITAGTGPLAVITTASVAIAHLRNTHIRACHPA